MKRLRNQMCHKRKLYPRTLWVKVFKHDGQPSFFTKLLANGEKTFTHRKVEVRHRSTLQVIVVKRDSPEPRLPQGWTLWGEKAKIRRGRRRNAA